MHNLSFNAFEFLVNFFNFIILMAIFYQIVIVGVGGMIRRRGRAVLARLDEVRMLQREASLAESRRAEQLAGLAREIADFRELTEHGRDTNCARIASEATLDFQHIVDRANREAETLNRLALEDYQRRVTHEAVLRVEKKLSALLTQEAQQDLVQNFLRKVGTLRAS